MTRATLGVVVACGAHFLVGADGLAVAIALPTIQDELGVAPIDAQWVLSAYGLAFGGCLLLAGRLGDHYGRRRLLVWGMALFTAGALLAGAAPGLAVLIAARALQGLGAAAAVPAALALIGSLVPPGRERTRALSLLAAMASVGIMSGLVIGGVATELLGWRWVFLVTAPFAAAVAAAAPRALPEACAEGDHARRPDAIGAALVTLGLLAVLLGVTRVEQQGPAAPSTVVPVLTGAALLAAFVAWERQAPAPLLRFEILRFRSLRGAAIGAAVNSVAFTAIVYVGTLYLQSALGYGPIEAGLALVPVDAVAFAVPLLAAHHLADRSPRALLAWSFALTAVGVAIYATVLTAVAGDGYRAAFLVATALAALGVAAATQARPKRLRG